MPFLISFFFFFFSPVPQKKKEKKVFTLYTFKRCLENLRKIHIYAQQRWARTHDPCSTIVSSNLSIFFSWVDRWRAVHGNESNNFICSKTPPCHFWQTMSLIPFKWLVCFDDYLCEGGRSVTRIGRGCSHKNKLFSQSPAPLTWEFGCEKKFPWGELNMLVRPFDSCLLILLHATTTHQAENSSVFSHHIKSYS